MEVSAAMGKVQRHVSTLGPRGSLALFVSALLAMALGAACEDGIGGGPSGDPLGLVPDDAYSVAVVDVEQILQGDAPDDLVEEIEDGWEDALDDMGVDIDDVSTMVIARGSEGTTIVLDGEFDFEQVRDELDDADYDDRDYRGYEMWEGGSRFVSSAALLEGSGQIVLGSVSVVQNVLKDLSRGSGSLLDDDQNNVLKALRKAGGGWEVSARETCNYSEVRGCEAIGTTISRGDEQYSVELTLAVLFRSERTAESEMGDLEDEIEDSLPRQMDIEEVRADGEFVIITIAIDEDDWDRMTDWR